MVIKVKCPTCGQKIKYSRAPEGTQGKCPRCGAIVLTVEAEEERASPTDTAAEPVQQSFVRNAGGETVEVELPRSALPPPPLVPPERPWAQQAPPTYYPPPPPAQQPIMPKRRSLFGRFTGRTPNPPVRGALARRGMGPGPAAPILPRGFVPNVYGQIAILILCSIIGTPIIGFILAWVFYYQARRIKYDTGHEPDGYLWLLIILILDCIGAAIVLVLVLGFLGLLGAASFGRVTPSRASGVATPSDTDESRSSGALRPGDPAPGLAKYDVLEDLKQRREKCVMEYEHAEADHDQALMLELKARCVAIDDLRIDQAMKRRRGRQSGSTGADTFESRSREETDELVRARTKEILGIR